MKLYNNVQLLFTKFQVCLFSSFLLLPFFFLPQPLCFSFFFLVCFGVFFCFVFYVTLFYERKDEGKDGRVQGSKFTVANVQFVTGSRTFTPKKNDLRANLVLYVLAHFHNEYMYIFCSLLDQIYS